MLSDTMRYTHNFSNNNQGSVAIFFAVMLIPVIGFLGAAVDYAIALRSRGIQQNISDEAALLIANAKTSAAAIAGLKFAHDEISKRFAKTSNQEDTSIVGIWLDGSRYKMTITIILKTMFIHVLPMMENKIKFSVTTTVTRVAPIYETKPPTSSLLSPEAADYNRIYLYCYSSDPARQKEADAGRR